MPTTTADDYPGVGSRTLSQPSCVSLTTCGDGHFVDVKTTILSVPEPESAGLLAFGVLLLALRAHARTRR